MGRSLELHIAAIDEEIRALLTGVDPSLQPFFGMMLYHLGLDAERGPSGKRLRPVLCTGRRYRRALPRMTKVYSLNPAVLLRNATRLMWGASALVLLGACALTVAFASSTQDIVVDAWRIEVAGNADELGLLSSAYQLGYRAALLITDALILVAAGHFGWPISYATMDMSGP